MPPPREGTWEQEASNPARLRLEPQRMLANDVTPILSSLLWEGLAVALVYRGHLVLAIVPAIFGVLGFLFRMRRWRNHLGYGCVNPAIIISQKPLRAAICTDLSQAGRPAPAIKVVKLRAAGLAGADTSVGRTLAAVCLYHPGGVGPGKNNDHTWGDISPIFVQQATANADQIQRVMDSIGAAEWDSLTRWMSRVDSKRVGLYKFWRPANAQFSVPAGVGSLWTFFILFMAILYAIALSVPAAM